MMNSDTNMSIKALFVFSLIGASVQVPGKLKVTIFYETLCRDSIAFIKNQFGPAHALIGDYLDVHWVPYGKARHFLNGDTYSFTCQHGPEECFGNTLHACAVTMKRDQAKDLFNYINCTTGISYYNEQALQKCSVNYKDVLLCAKGPIGGILLAHYGKLSQEILPITNFVPTVVFNDVYNQYFQNRALTDFFGASCDLLNRVPAKCKRMMLNYY